PVLWGEVGHFRDMMIPDHPGEARQVGVVHRNDTQVGLAPDELAAGGTAQAAGSGHARHASLSSSALTTVSSTVMRAWRLSLADTTCQGACRVLVRSIMSFAARV